MALSDYQIALNNFNAAMNADPVLRALNDDRRAWGDIMLEYDEQNRPAVIETMDQFIARINVTPSAPPAGEPQTFRSWNADQPQRQPQRQQQRQPQRQQRFDQRPPRHDSNTRLPAAAQKQQKRPRNNFAALSEEDSE
jgi:hypothetical protein